MSSNNRVAAAARQLRGLRGPPDELEQDWDHSLGDAEDGLHLPLEGGRRDRVEARPPRLPLRPPRTASVQAALVSCGRDDGADLIGEPVDEGVERRGSRVVMAPPRGSRPVPSQR